MVILQDHEMCTALQKILARLLVRQRRNRSEMIDGLLTLEKEMSRYAIEPLYGT